jgi:hypothetical protein
MRDQGQPTEIRTVELANVLVFLLATEKVAKQTLREVGGTLRHWNNTEKITIRIIGQRNKPRLTSLTMITTPDMPLKLIYTGWLQCEPPSHCMHPGDTTT